MSVLNSQQKQSYQENGFLVLENFIAPALCDMLMTRAHELIQDFNPNDHRIVFSSGDQRHAKHDYFLASSEKIHFFFEEKALDKAGNLTTDKLLSINKIGHALHDIDPVFMAFSRMHQLAALVNDIGIHNPLLLQSMYICKQPYIGDEVNCHQDATYLMTNNEPVIGLWFALEDATIKNGCLWAIPGAHHDSVKSKAMRDENNHVTTHVYDDTPWDLDKMIPLEVRRGSCIVLHGWLPHMSKVNTSAKSRHAYSLHIISHEDDYPKTNWLQRSTDFPLRGFV